MNSTVQRFRFGRFEVRPAQRLLLADGEDANIGARAFDTLVALIERRDRVVSRDELFDLVWPGLVVEENNLRQQVAALRKVLGAAVVATVPGRGYRFAMVLDGETIAPPALAARTGLQHNLPLSPTALIGREAELATVLDLLAGTHLLTLVGAGGVGKTRFALEVADTVLGNFKDGVWFVALAPVADPSLVTRTVAGVLGVHEEPGRPLIDTLLDFLRHRELLIVLDNCEHVIDACAQWSDTVLRTSARTRTLATSREALGIDGERVWRMPSLRAAVPDAEPSPDELMDYPATRLFVQRATAASPAFRLISENAAAVALLCHQLDGIPLALELAAARVAAMRVEQVAERLRDRFGLLTRGNRTAPPRHQALRSLIDWSHDLLTEPERALLRRLSVFAGGWTLEAAEATCSGDGLAIEDILDLLTQLVEKSLVAFDDPSSGPRYRMLETIRQYGLEKLLASGEAAALRRRHLQHFVGFAEAIRSKLVGLEERQWNARAESELDNLRAALTCSLEPGHAELGLRLVNALHGFWYHNLHWKEIIGWIERLSMQAGEDGSAALQRAHSLYVAGMLLSNFDPPAARRHFEECLATSRALDSDSGVAWALTGLAYVDSRKRDPATAELFTESLRIGRGIQDPWEQAMLTIQCLICHAGYEMLMGRDDAVEAMVRDCEAANARLGHSRRYSGHCHALLGKVASRRGQHERAGKLLAESLALYRAIDAKFDIAGSLVQLGYLALHQGDAIRALELFRESLSLHRNYPTSRWITSGLANLLIAYVACEQWTIAARLAGALNGTRAEGAPAVVLPELSGRVQRAYEAAFLRIRAALGDSAFKHECNAGAQITREQAIELALTKSQLT
ncbi:ATP-binding protein [Variovorax rhizosphaerae]|uniref:Winged helix-turn-helix domain-containing protein n=1 Tax=Variovorax rhizosphaerae TaxID=1836200 RepID=A0ABU8WM71_9BURK